MAERKKSVQTLLDSAGDGKQAQRLARAEDLAPLEFQAAQTRKLQRIVSKLADRLEAESGELPVTSLAINIGIISDKLRELGAKRVVQLEGISENVTFPLPKGLGAAA